MTDRAPIHVALVEDDPGVRTRLARVINADDSLKFVHAASSVNDILAWVWPLPTPLRSGMEGACNWRRPIRGKRHRG